MGHIASTQKIFVLDWSPRRRKGENGCKDIGQGRGGEPILIRVSQQFLQEHNNVNEHVVVYRREGGHVLRTPAYAYVFAACLDERTVEGQDWGGQVFQEIDQGNRKRVGRYFAPERTASVERFPQLVQFADLGFLDEQVLHLHGPVFVQGIDKAPKLGGNANGGRGLHAAPGGSPTHGSWASTNFPSGIPKHVGARTRNRQKKWGPFSNLSIKMSSNVSRPQLSV